ncbi:MAG: hypothetical protein U0930_00510 [Pirellulales bacterium]
MVTYYTLTTCLFLTLCIYSPLFAEEPKSKLLLSLRHSHFAHDADSSRNLEKYPVKPTYDATISHATTDPKLTSFLDQLAGLTISSLTIDGTKLTDSQSRKLTQIYASRLVVSNYELSEEFAKSIGGIQYGYLTLKQTRLSNPALSALLKGKMLIELEAEEVRGCSAEGWSELSKLQRFSLQLTDCDFDDNALVHLSSTGCDSLQLINTQITGKTLGSLKTLRNLKKLSLSGGPIVDEGLLTLPELPELRELDLSGTRITNDGFRNLVVPPRLFKIQWQIPW